MKKFYFWLAILLVLVMVAGGIVWRLRQVNVDASEVAGAEVCDNGIDDDLDGKVDECWDPGTNYSVLRNLYVDLSRGNNSNSGLTADQAFKSVSAATAIAKAGDAINIAPGSYNEEVRLTNEGTPSNPIIIRAANPNNRPIINNYPNPSSGFRAITPRSNTIIDGIITEGYETVNSSGHSLGGMGIHMDEGTINNVLINNCILRNHTEALRASSGDRLIVRNTQALGNEDGFLIGVAGTDSYTNTLFENDEASASAYRDANNDGWAIEGKYSHHVIRNSSSHGFVDAGFDSKANGTVLDGVKAYGNARGIKMWRSASVMNSISFNNSTLNYQFGSVDSYGNKWKLVNSISYRGNVSFENWDGNGFATASTVTFSHNIFADTEITDLIGGLAAKGDHNIYYQSDTVTTAPNSTSKVIDPKLIFDGKQSFSLAVDSPAINAGAATNPGYLPFKDALGIKRPQGSAIDIGPFEKAESSGGNDDSSGGGDSNDDTAIEVNNAPVIVRIDNQTAYVLRPISLYVRVSDPDGDKFTLAGANLPDGSAFNTTTGEFSWSPKITDGSLAGTNYTLTFTATDEHSLSSKIECRITVLQIPSRIYVSLSANPRKGTAPLKVNFNATASTGKGVVASYNWDFGDGSAPASTRTASHVYTKRGVYDVTLTVKTNVNTYSQKSFPIYVR